MRRREFITLIGGAAATWSLVARARAQQGERVRRIGVLMSLAADDRQGQTRLDAFVRGLQELGWIDGRNLQIDTRWAAGEGAQGRKYAAELVALAPDVILASGGSVVGPLLQATHTVPIVFTQTPIPSALGLSIAWRAQAATQPDFQLSITALVGNGWIFSSKSRRA